MPTLAGALTGLGRLALPGIVSPTYRAATPVSDTWSLQYGFESSSLSVNAAVPVSDSWAMQFSLETADLAIVAALPVSDSWSLAYGLESSAITLANQVAGTDAWALAFTAEAGSVQTYARQLTQLGLLSVPGRYVAIASKASSSIQVVNATDAWLLGWVEQDTDLVLIDTWDTWALSWNETTGLSIAQTFSANDSWALTWLDVASVFQGGPVLREPVDSWALAMADAATVAATADSTDVWSLSITDGAVTFVSSDDKTVSDTWSLAFELESGFFTQVVDIPIIASDEWVLVVDETARVVPFGNDIGTRLIRMRAVRRIVRKK